VQKNQKKRNWKKVAEQAEGVFQTMVALSTNLWQRRQSWISCQFEVAFLILLSITPSNQLNPSQKGKLLLTSEVKNQAPDYVEGTKRKGVKVERSIPGWDLGGFGVFSKSEPFSIQYMDFCSKVLTDGAIFHEGSGAVLITGEGYSFEFEK